MEKSSPQEMSGLVDDRALTTAKAQQFAVTLLDLEVRRNPGKVGYPLTIYTIGPTGNVRKANYARRRAAHSE